MNGVDPYAVLGVARTASPPEIRRAYREQMMRWHPDRNPSSEAPGQATAINRAYDLLSNATARAAYDRASTTSWVGGTGPFEPTAGGGPLDDVDLRIRDWPARLAVWTSKLGVLEFPVVILLGLIEWAFEWVDVALIGVRVFAKMRPWPKAAYWILWETATVLWCATCLTTALTKQQTANQIAGLTAWLMLLMPVLYFVGMSVIRGVARLRRRSKAPRLDC